MAGLVVLSTITVGQLPGQAQLPEAGEQATDSAATASTRPLQFNFSGAPWREVLQWFAEQADLSLQMDGAPSGTVNFADTGRNYSVGEGLDLINRLLLDRGWALVRRGRMLLLVDLEADNAEKLISEMAEVVTPEQFDGRGNSDIVRCVFPLGGLTPEQAREELQQIVGPWGRVTVLGGARQVIVTETVGKLKTIDEVLHAAEALQTNVVEIPLEHRTAEEVLEVARPLLGLQPGENSGDDIRISVSLYGDRLFATGQPSQTGLLESVVARADRPLPGSETEESDQVAAPLLKTHQVTTADLQTTFDVLQTLLAGTPDARLAMDQARGAIVASARPETQQLISETIAELEGSGTEFTVIDLKRLEPAQALLTINKFFGVTPEDPKGPIVDGDPATGRLWVRGTKEQVQTVQRLITELENDPLSGGLGENVRILPLTGSAARETIEQLELLWPLTGRPNRLRVLVPSRESGRQQQNMDGADRPSPGQPGDAAGNGAAGNGVAGNDAAKNDAAKNRDGVVGGAETWVWQLPSQDESSDDPGESGSAEVSPASSDGPRSGSAAPDVIVQMTPAGLIVASQDAQALDRIEDLIASLGTATQQAGELPTIFWLRFIKADVAAELVAGVLGGADTASGSGGSLTESVMGGLGGGMLGGLLGLGGESAESSSDVRSVYTTRGSVNIVPDNRLNALIVQAPPADIEFIRVVLQEVDREESPEEIRTIARPALIPVVYQDAGEVAEIVKAVFAEKVGGGAGSGGRNSDDNPSPQDFFAALRGGRGGGRGGRGGGGGGDTPAKTEASKIIVAVDQRSNSLVVTASPQDFQMVRDLVETLDQQGMDNEQSVQVVPIAGNIRPDVLQQALSSVLGIPTQSTSVTDQSGGSSSNASTRGSRTASGGSDDGPSPEEIRRRIEFFRSRMGDRSGGGDGGRGTARGGGSSRRGTDSSSGAASRRGGGRGR